MMDRRQLDLGFSDITASEREGRVECLGKQFDSEHARRAYFLEILKEKLRDPNFRGRPDFPLADDIDILRLSDPPYYTACPNPFLAEFVKYHGRPYNPKETYHREPLAVDVSEGKTDVVYKAHGYHTKVPHLAIVPSILHYTKPGDIILDGFCGSGMTGVAAQWCGMASPEFQQTLEAQWAADHRAAPEWGIRRVILGDLSPAATFIAANYNLPFDFDAFVKAGQELLSELEGELGWMYETLHKDGKTKGKINYTVWSEAFSCPECTGDVVFVREALDRVSKRVKEEFPCPHCAASLTKSRLHRLYVSRYDTAIKTTVKVPKRVPVLIEYTVGRSTHEKEPDEHDIEILRRVEALGFPEEVPSTEIPHMHMTHERARMDSVGVTHLHHFFLPRAAHALAAMWRRARRHEDPRTRNMLLFFVEQAIWGMSILARYAPTHFSQVNQYLTGVYYVGSQIVDVSLWYILDGKLDRLMKAFKPMPTTSAAAAITTGDCGRLPLPDNSIDYVFTDPPFGENIYYADLNYLVESWHRIFTRAELEAIIDQAKSKRLLDYQHLMQRCFEEYCRVLKPGRWMTVVFHNSKNAVWNAIQEAMLAAGFVVADVRTLDKKQGSYRQVTSTAVKQDLVISAYKPNGGLEQRFKLSAGTEDGVWDFVRTHLRQLPVAVVSGSSSLVSGSKNQGPATRDQRLEIIAERQNYLLFDRMVAFHVQRGVTVPLSAAEFYAGLEQRFPSRDGMYFLSEQVAEYDKKRITVKDVETPEFTPVDEFSAIRWLQNLLRTKPQTFQEIHPQFLRDIGGWQKHEKPLELSELLEQSFLRYDGKGAIPAQIVSWMKQSSKLRELIRSESRVQSSESENQGLETRNSELLREAKDRWYMPDPNKAGDLEKLRERSLLKEFEEYRESKQKSLKVFRLEAVRTGFKKAWQERDYATIIAVARKIPENVLQEDPKLLMWYDQAVTRTGEE